MATHNFSTFIPVTINKVTAYARKLVHSKLRHATAEWQKYFIQKVKETKHGRRYWMGDGWHIASAEQEYPAYLSGRLTEGLRFFVSTFNPNSNKVRIYILSEAPYTKHLIKGHHVRIPKMLGSNEYITITRVAPRKMFNESKKAFLDLVRKELKV